MEVEDRTNEEMLETARRAVSSALATVPGLHPDTEDSLIGQQQWQAIHERRAAGQGVSKIARELELDRKTVRSSLRQSSWEPYRRQVSAPTMLDCETLLYDRMRTVVIGTTTEESGARRPKFNPTFDAFARH